MENKYQWLINKSCQFDNNNIISSLSNINWVLDSIVYQDDAYSFESYRTLLILNHNFRAFLDPDYLGQKANLSFLSYQIKAYYAYGGNEDIIFYLTNLGLYKERLLEAELLGKEIFVVRCFVSPFLGIPEDLKKLCECPDFYPEITSEIIKKIYQKK